MSKYHNRKTEVNGVLFDSRHEAHRWIELQYMQRAGMIHDLQRQVSFELIPAIREGKKVVQRAVVYVADFVYLGHNGAGWEKVVEDAKGVRTDVYKIKKKLMRWRHGIEIKEV